MLDLLLEISARATLLIAAVAVVLWALRIKTAAVRHAAWASVVAGMLLLPALVAWGPRVSLAVLPAEAAGGEFAPVILEMGGDVGVVSGPTGVAAVISSARHWSWEDYALWVYLVGLGFFLMRLAVGTFQVRRLVRSAELDRGKLVHRGCSTPITVGCWRPTVILPSDWAQWPQAQLEAVLAHEDAHVRRRDPLFQWLALLNRAVFWFHPLAWWLERMLSGLAEEVCDAAVLSRGHDPADYSRYLLAMARVAQESGARVQSLGMAMPGVGLRERIGNIMSGVRNADVSRARLTCIGVLIAGTAAILTTVSVAHAQQPLPTFDVASVKLAAGGANGRFMRLPGPGRVSINNYTLQDLIQYAYGPIETPLEGGPKWINETSFDIEAQGPATATPPELRLMLRALLAERFALKIHTDRKDAPAYALVLARGDGKLGPKVVETTGKPCGGRQAPPDPAMPRCSAQISPLGISIKSGTMAHLANILSLPLTDFGRPVIDRTGIAGDFNFDLEFAFRPPNSTGAPVPADTLGPSIFTALQEQFGLKLENARAAVEVLVVDSAEKPSEN